MQEHQDKTMLTYGDSQVALGCKIDLLLVSDATRATVDEYFRQLWLEIFEFECRCSRFLPDSELSQFNKSAGLRRQITPEFRSALLAARDMAEVSEGLYNPFILPALQREGYVQSMVAKYRDDPVDDFSDRSVVPPDKLEIGDDWASIPYGTAIDLGGCGKGYAGDMLADLADTFPEVGGYWFSLGGDVVSGGLDEAGNPWTVAIESAADPSSSVATVAMPDAKRYAVATSAPVRSAPKIGRAYTHIIDPRTGQPVEADISLATVSADRALLADVLASCAIIVGKAGAESYLAKDGVVGALLQVCGEPHIELDRTAHHSNTTRRRTRSRKSA